VFLAQLAASGEMPLDFMLRVMRDPAVDLRMRMAMAVAAAPYVHPRLAAVAQRHTDADGSPIGPTLTLIERIVVERQPEPSHEASARQISVDGANGRRHEYVDRPMVETRHRNDQ
jgi:hypothetical protein